MQSVYKYKLTMAGNFELRMPVGAKLLTVQVQCGHPCVWAMVDTTGKMATRKFALRGTGHQCEPEVVGAAFVGTFQLNDGEFIGHLFDLGESGRCL